MPRHGLRAWKIGGPMVSRALLQAELANANAQGQISRQATRIPTAGKETFPAARRTSLARVRARARPDDIDRLRRRITELDQTVVDLTRQLEERGEELDAARAANREMITYLNTSPRTIPRREP